MSSETEWLEMLDALKQSHRRYLAALETCASLVERQANQGDPLAKYVIEELDKAEIALKAENMAGHAFLDEAKFHDGSVQARRTWAVEVQAQEYGKLKRGDFDAKVPSSYLESSGMSSRTRVPADAGRAHGRGQGPVDAGKSLGRKKPSFSIPRSREDPFTHHGNNKAEDCQLLRGSPEHRQRSRARGPEDHEG